MKKYYLNEEEITEEEFNKQLEGCVNEYASMILKKCDPVVYRCCVDSYASSIMGEAKYKLKKHGYCEINGDTFEIEEEEDGEYGKIEVLGYDTKSAEFTRGF